jgi:hypothetical protein
VVWPDSRTALAGRSAGSGPAANATADEQATLSSEVRHWQHAVATLADLDAVATPAAWAGLEAYLGRGIRASLTSTTTRLRAAADRVAADLAAAAGAEDLVRVRRELLALRRGYLGAEAVLAFFGDAVGSRANPRLGAVLRGLDALAVDSMERVLGPLGIEVPPVLTYLDKGLGASLLRAGARLWDASLSPAAAIKITHHNLWQPTSLIHETGHQVAHLTGWNAELAEALEALLAGVSPLAARTWRSWASEVAADVYAFVLLGYAPLPALATVVDGTTASVLRMPFGDPHPFGWIRVQFNVALCRSWYGPGPWDRLGRVWARRHRLDQGDPHAVAVARASLPMLDALADACTRAPMRAFGGRPLSALADPRRVAPAELARLARRAGPSLYTSSYLFRLEAMPILAWTMVRRPGAAGGADPAAVEAWLRRIAGERVTAG